jgi:hypothetical protein
VLTDKEREQVEIIQDRFDGLGDREGERQFTMYVINDMSFLLSLIGRLTEWVPVAVKRPKRCEDVLCRVVKSYDVASLQCPTVAIGSRKSSAWQCDGIGRCVVTHWMPLPDPPASS